MTRPKKSRPDRYAKNSGSRPAWFRRMQSA